MPRIFPVHRIPSLFFSGCITICLLITEENQRDSFLSRQNQVQDILGKRYNDAAKEGHEPVGPLAGIMAFEG